MRTCAVVVKLERGNAKGLVLSDAGRQLLFAEAEEPRLAADQIRDYCRGHQLDVSSLSIDVEEGQGAAKAVRKVIARIAGERLGRVA